MVGISECQCGANQIGRHQRRFWETPGHHATPLECLGGVINIAEEHRRHCAMTKSEEQVHNPGRAEAQPYRVRLPGFLIENETGLGDAIKKVFYATGIKPCSGCDERATKLNRWMVFSR